MFSLINLEQCRFDDDQSLPNGHTRTPMDVPLRNALEDQLQSRLPDDIWQILVDHQGFSAVGVPIPCCPRITRPPEDDGPLPDRWIGHLFVFGNYTVGSNGAYHSFSYGGALRCPWDFLPSLTLPFAEYGHNNLMLISLRPDSFGKVLVDFFDDDPNRSEFFPQPEPGQEVDPIVACQEVAPSLEAFFRGLTNVSDEEYDEWLKISY